MDEILRDPDTPSDEYVLDLEVKSLRDTRDLLEKVGLKDALGFIEENPHPRLWRLLAEAALEALDLQMAEAAYVRCKDYPGILFTKTLTKIQNQTVKKAEVSAWFKDFDEAERLYLEADMRPLAVRMRKRLGDWFKVIQLLKTGSGGNDAEMEEAYNEVSKFFKICNICLIELVKLDQVFCVFVQSSHFSYFEMFSNRKILQINVTGFFRYPSKVV